MENIPSYLVVRRELNAFALVNQCRGGKNPPSLSGVALVSRPVLSPPRNIGLPFRGWVYVPGRWVVLWALRGTIQAGRQEGQGGAQIIAIVYLGVWGFSYDEMFEGCGCIHVAPACHLPAMPGLSHHGCTYSPMLC